MRGLPPRLASTTSLSAVGASIMPNSLAVNTIGRTFQRNGTNYDRDGRDLPEQVGSDTRLG